MFITVEQIKAARALLKWTQKDLAANAGLNDDQVHNYEASRTRSLEVLEAIYKSFSAQGIEFVEGGVIQHALSSYVLNSYLEVLEEIVIAFPDGGEVCLHCADDRRSPPAVSEKVKQIEAMGIILRITVSDDNYFITGNHQYYRQIPADYFAVSPDVIVIYNDKVVFRAEDKFLVIVNKALSRTFKDQFEYWWHVGKEVDAAKISLIR
jgi:transcriptional regulator with XRE-family HTH domain